MENCYALLGVREDASAREIRQAFRKRAKELHPDAGGNARSSREFHRVVQAYRILSDAGRRALFDERRCMHRTAAESAARSFDYHEWLMARTDDESRAKLIVWDVLHLREDEAVEEFKRMSVKPTFNLRTWFSYEDFMDYGFILAEELALRSEYYDAFNLLEQIIELERRHDYFRLFFPEVLEFTRTIVRQKVAVHLSDELALDVWERALNLGFPPADNAWMLHRMSAIYAQIGDAPLSDVYAAAALRETAAALQTTH
ncbi:MAG: DnaJ domain-containing protein [Treponema sp.]|nr:DnaJ domain-containing protein [Treponema sp.]